MGQTTELYKGISVMPMFKFSSKFRIRLEATSVGIGTEKLLRGLVLKKLPPCSILNFFPAYSTWV